MSTLAMAFRHNLWANRRILDACAGLSDAQLDATVEGTAGTVRDTLKHIAGAERRYVAALRGTYDQQPPPDREIWPGVAALRDAVSESGQALIELCEAIPGETTVRGVRRGEPFELPAWHFFVQSINHATEHRSQVATILTQQGIQPPAMDSWTFMTEGAS